MFHRYLITASFIIAVITIGMVLTFSTSADAYPMNRMTNLETPRAISARLIMKTIDNYNPYLSKDQKNTICQTIINESIETDLDPFLTTAVIAAESSFIPDAVSPCAAQGLMQLTTVVSRMMKIENPFDIKENIYAGTRYLQSLYRIFKNTDLTLAAYNAGPTRVARLGRIPRISETINYIHKVQQVYQALQNRFRIAMVCLSAYPEYFRSEKDPAWSLSAANGQERNPTGKHLFSGPLTVFFETRRYMKYGKSNLPDEIMEI